MPRMTNNSFALSYFNPDNNAPSLDLSLSSGKKRGRKKKKEENGVKDGGGNLKDGNMEQREIDDRKEGKDVVGGSSNEKDHREGQEQVGREGKGGVITDGKRYGEGEKVTLSSSLLSSPTPDFQSQPREQQQKQQQLSPFSSPLSSQASSPPRSPTPSLPQSQQQARLQSHFPSSRRHLSTSTLTSALQQISNQNEEEEVLTSRRDEGEEKTKGKGKEETGIKKAQTFPTTITHQDHPTPHPHPHSNSKETKEKGSSSPFLGGLVDYSEEEEEEDLSALSDDDEKEKTQEGVGKDGDAIGGENEDGDGVIDMEIDTEEEGEGTGKERPSSPLPKTPPPRPQNNIPGTGSSFPSLENAQDSPAQVQDLLVVKNRKQKENTATPVAQNQPQKPKDSSKEIEVPRPVLLQMRTEEMGKKQTEADGVLKNHEGLVRELFHMENFGSMIKFNLETAREDHSSLWGTFYQKYDLVSQIADTAVTGVRKTRRQVEERKGKLQYTGSTLSLEPIASTSRQTLDPPSNEAPASSNTKGRGKTKATTEPISSSDDLSSIEDISSFPGAPESIKRPRGRPRKDGFIRPPTSTTSTGRGRGRGRGSSRGRGARGGRGRPRGRPPGVGRLALDKIRFRQSEEEEEDDDDDDGMFAPEESSVDRSNSEEEQTEEGESNRDESQEDGEVEESQSEEDESGASDHDETEDKDQEFSRPEISMAQGTAEETPSRGRGRGRGRGWGRGWKRGRGRGRGAGRGGAPSPILQPTTVQVSSERKPGRPRRQLSPSGAPSPTPSLNAPTKGLRFTFKGMDSFRTRSDSGAPAEVKGKDKEIEPDVDAAVEFSSEPITQPMQVDLPPIDDQSQEQPISQASVLARDPELTAPSTLPKKRKSREHYPYGVRAASLRSSTAAAIELVEKLEPPAVESPAPPDASGELDSKFQVEPELTPAPRRGRGRKSSEAVSVSAGAIEPVVSSRRGRGGSAGRKGWRGKKRKREEVEPEPEEDAIIIDPTFVRTPSPEAPGEAPPAPLLEEPQTEELPHPPPATDPAMIPLRSMIIPDLQPPIMRFQDPDNPHQNARAPFPPQFMTPFQRPEKFASSSKAELSWEQILEEEVAPEVDEGDPLSGIRRDDSEWEKRIEAEKMIQWRIAVARAEGLDLNTFDPSMTKRPKPPPPDPDKTKDHQESLVENAAHLAKLLSERRKNRMIMAKKISRMVMHWWEHERGKEGRLKNQEEKLRRIGSRKLAKEIRKKWNEAIELVQAQKLAEQQREEQLETKRQLDAILERSNQLLIAQREEEEEDEDQEELRFTDEERSDSDDDEAEDGQKVGEEEEEENHISPANKEQNSTIQILEDALKTLPTDVTDGTPSTDELPNPPLSAPCPPIEPKIPESLPTSETPGEASGEPSIEPTTSSSPQPRFSATPSTPASQQPNDLELFDPPVIDTSMADIQGVDRDEDIEADEDSEASSDSSEDGGGMSLGEAFKKAGLSIGKKTKASEKPPMANGITEGEDDSDFEGEDEQSEDGDYEDEMENSSEDEDQRIPAPEDDSKLSPEELRRKYWGSETNLEVADGGKDNGKDETREQGMLDNASSQPDVNGTTDLSPDNSIPEPAKVDAPPPSPPARSTPPRQAEDLGPKIRIPFLLRATLRPYQHSGLEWLSGLHANRTNGILADEMGLGKTIQTIGLFAHLACEKGIWGPHLVVVPTSVILNWEMEFKKFFPGFKILTYYGDQKERKQKRVGWNSENAFNVCVTSYQLILSDHHVFRRKPWYYMVLDEAHHIKNFRSQRWQTLLGFNTRFRLLLTGTPLQNNLMELWSLLYFLMPQEIAQQEGGVFANHKEFNAWFSNPMDRAIESGEVLDEETRSTVNKLHTVLRPYLLRRMKADVETQLPQKHEYVVYCRLSKRQRYLYDEFMSRAKTKETLSSGHFLNIINCLMQLRKVCNHPDLFEVRPVVTSFIMFRSVLSNFEPTFNLLNSMQTSRFVPESEAIDRNFLKLDFVCKNESDPLRSASLARLDASSLLPSLYEIPEDIDLSVKPPLNTSRISEWKTYSGWKRHDSAVQRYRRLSVVNHDRCHRQLPPISERMLRKLEFVEPLGRPRNPPPGELTLFDIVPDLLLTREQHKQAMLGAVERFAFMTPPARALDIPQKALPGIEECDLEESPLGKGSQFLNHSSVKLSIAFPDKALLQYDCGKLQKLDHLLRSLVKGNHRALIFTQMTKVLDVLESWLTFHGYLYLRLDGSTKIEDRQMLTERFNRDPKYLAFISSTRSGGLGINLTGADTVIFFDSDWNPSMDRQCQDRCHRIGQQREVSIYRLVSSNTIEENMLRKANQKRLLDDLVIQGGDFTTDYFNKVDWRDMLGDGLVKELGIEHSREPPKANATHEIREAFAAVEDEEDAQAAAQAEEEFVADRTDFGVDAGRSRDRSLSKEPFDRRSNEPESRMVMDQGEQVQERGQEEAEESEGRSASRTPVGGAVDSLDRLKEDLEGTVEGYMVNYVEDDWDYFEP